LLVIAIVAPLIFVAELPDKTALASLVLGTRYRPSWVFTGVAAAFAAHVVLAVAVGELFSLLPHRVVEAAVGRCFCSARFCCCVAATTRTWTRTAPGSGFGRWSGCRSW
jgi:putative Ca2+/H+ antiporter (TMEM165/GDT1 family)